jgi:hypothetical protein
MARCRKCGYKLKNREVFDWVNSGIEQLECQGCDREINSPVVLFLLYFVWAIPVVVSINYIHEIAFYFRSHGVDIPDFLVVLCLVLPFTLMLYVSAYVISISRA